MSVRVIADAYVRPEAMDEFLAAATEMRTLTRAHDAGCMAYDLFRDKADPQHLTMIEEWADQAAFSAHIASEHFRRLLPQMAAYTDQARHGTVTIYEPAL